MQVYSIAQHSGESRENVHTVNSSTQEERFPLTILPLNPVLSHLLAPPLASSFILAFFCPAAAQAFSLFSYQLSHVVRKQLKCTPSTFIPTIKIISF